jgi:hypothetical protein
MHVYVFGNGNLSFADFLTHYHGPLTGLPFAEGARVLVGDFRGVDTLAMECLKCLTPNVCVYHVGARPRYFPDKFRTEAGRWRLAGNFADDAARDAAAIEACSHFLAYDFNSDANRRSGTSRAIERCLELGKHRLGAAAG